MIQYQQYLSHLPFLPLPFLQPSPLPGPHKDHAGHCPQIDALYPYRPLQWFLTPYRGHTQGHQGWYWPWSDVITVWWVWAWDDVGLSSQLIHATQLMNSVHWMWLWTYDQTHNIQGKTARTCHHGQGLGLSFPKYTDVWTVHDQPADLRMDTCSVEQKIHRPTQTLTTSSTNDFGQISSSLLPLSDSDSTVIIVDHIIRNISQRHGNTTSRKGL